MPPSFCRHNRFVQNCPICKPSAHPPKAPKPERSTRPTRARGASPRRSSVVVRRDVRAVEDGFRSELVPGLKASGDAERLADELAFAVARLHELSSDPPGLYAEIAAEPDVEEAAWTAFLVALLCPLTPDDGDPFATVRAVHVPWSTGEAPAVTGATTGPRAAPGRAAGPGAPAAGADLAHTVAAYRGWAARAGSQEAALSGEASWSPERRFDRVLERLALPGFARPARYELLLTLGRLGRLDVRPTALHLSDDATTLAAKRVFGIGDVLLLGRRARELAEAGEVPIEALDLGLFNWAQPAEARATMGSDAAPDPDTRELVAAALGL